MLVQLLSVCIAFFIRIPPSISLEGNLLFLHFGSMQFHYSMVNAVYQYMAFQMPQCYNINQLIHKLNRKKISIQGEILLLLSVWIFITFREHQRQGMPIEIHVTSAKVHCLSTQNQILLNQDSAKCEWLYINACCKLQTNV